MSALTPILFSRNRTSILTTEYSEVPFKRTEFRELDSLEFLLLSQQILVLVEAEVSLKVILVGM